MFTEDSLERVADITQEVVDAKCHELLMGDIVNEDDFSSALVSSLRDHFNGIHLKQKFVHRPVLGGGYEPDFSVHARTTTSRTTLSEENMSGADIMMGFRGVINDEDVVKATLIQAKLFDGKKFYSFPEALAERKYLLAQCLRMMKIAGDGAYVVVYSRIGVRFFPAKQYIDSYRRGLSYDHGQEFSEFMRGLFRCNIGNPNLDYMKKGGFKPYLRSIGIKYGFEAELEEIEF